MEGILPLAAVQMSRFVLGCNVEVKCEQQTTIRYSILHPSAKNSLAIQRPLLVCRQPFTIFNGPKTVEEFQKTRSNGRHKDGINVAIFQAPSRGQSFQMTATFNNVGPNN